MGARRTISLLYILAEVTCVALHPLDPLTLFEISQAVKLIEDTKFPPDAQYVYNYLTLKEPPKAVLLPYFLSGQDPPDTIYPRKAFAFIIERRSDNAYEVVVNLKDGRIESKKSVSQFVPKFYLSGTFEANSERNREIILSDTGITQKIISLGYTPNSTVFIGGSFRIFEDNPLYNGKRLVQVLPCGINSYFDNNFAHPMNFIVVLDWDKEQIVEIVDLPIYDDFSYDDRGQTAPKEEANYDYKLRGGKSFLRQDSKIKVQSPEGHSYSIDGRVLKWQKWKMHVGFNAREGIVINHLTYNDSGTVRPLLYRGALAEMFVPYGDPRSPFQRKQVFDLGLIHFGQNCFSQRLGEDVIGVAAFFNQYLADSSGMPVFFGNNVGITEEDVGIAWKHVDFRTGSRVTVRSHRLSISTIATLGNYDYGIYWHFYQDGSVELLAKLTGIVSVNMMAINSLKSPYASTMKSQVNAQYHQHFFTVRLDTDIDGTGNSILTSDVLPINAETGSPENKYGNAFTTVRTPLKTAGQGKTKIAPKNGRIWVISNPNRIHPSTKQPVSWKLVPAVPLPGLLMKQDCFTRPIAAFLDYEFWVTRYKEDQLYPGGVYLNNSGLPEWVDSDPNVSVDNEDIVLWYSFGNTHIPRVEDWPVMPVEEIGFWLKPYNYFLQNPSVDVPPSGIY